jgi:hypothetical protein
VGHQYQPTQSHGIDLFSAGDSWAVKVPEEITAERPFRVNLQKLSSGDDNGRRPPVWRHGGRQLLLKPLRDGRSVADTDKPMLWRVQYRRHRPGAASMPDNRRSLRPQTKQRQPSAKSP